MQSSLFGGNADVPGDPGTLAPAPPSAPVRHIPLLERFEDLVLGEAEKRAALEAVRGQALTCRRCPLSRSRRNVVFGDGNPLSPLVLVGEGPGETEDERGLPFVGPAGRLLERALHANSIRREQVYICNTVKCRAADFESGRWNNRPPTPEESDHCQTWLEQQLGIIRPLVIVCIGSPAANAVIKKGFKITQERGRWFDTSPYAPWVIAALHPAYVLRMQGAQQEAAMNLLIQDIGAARKRVIELRKAARAAVAPNEPNEPNEPDSTDPNGPTREQD